MARDRTDACEAGRAGNAPAVSGATGGQRLARGYAWVVVALRWPIIVIWLAVLAASLLFLPALGGSGSAPLSDIVPSGGKAVAAQERALRLFGSTVATDTLAVERNPAGLTRAALEAQLQAARSATRTPGVRGAVPVPNTPVPGVRWRERDTTIVTYLFLSPDENLIERESAARAYLASLPPAAAGTERGITGAGPARLAQWDEIDDALPWMEGATVLTILLIVALYFRSVGAPLVTLATAALAYVIAVRALAWSGERADVTAPTEIEPVLVVLLLGLVTDYTVFFMAETRRRLREGFSRVDAARAATARVGPLVFAAGVLVAGCALALLAGELRFFRVFGPGLAVAALVVTLVCLTLVPALMGALGPWLFGRRVRELQRAGQDAEPQPAGARPEPVGRGSSTRRFLARLPTAKPVAALLVAVCAGVLVVAALGTRSVSLSVSFIPSLPSHSEPRQAADAAARGFAPGILSPTEVILEQPGIAGRTAELTRLQGLLAREQGVAAVLGAAQTREQAPSGVVVSRDGGAARFAVVLRDEPTGADAIATYRRLERRTPQLVQEAGLPPGVRASYGGETALSAETVDALVSDLRRVVVATAIVTFVLLAVFLRALVAPLLLLAGSVLAFAGSFGLTALLLPDVLGTSEVIYYVPLVAAVMLVGLGSDYNVFIAGRIREETHRRDLRDAIAAGATSASRTITVAGITLALTFALLALVPLLPFRQLALLMTLGVLIDALLVRSVLVPALIALSGRVSWWPRPPRPHPAEP
jgi:RND superfamily putative drug exporter